MDEIKRYRVTWKETETHEVEVQAISEQEAKELAGKVANIGNDEIVDVQTSDYTVEVV